MTKIITVVFLMTGFYLFLNGAVGAETNVNISQSGGGVETKVKIETNSGNNTICQNGECQTQSTGNTKSKICVNGQCYFSEDGNLNFSSNSGGVTVKIKNETGGDILKKKEVKQPTPAITGTDKKSKIKPEVNLLNNFFNRLRSLFKDWIF